MNWIDSDFYYRKRKEVYYVRYLETYELKTSVGGCTIWLQRVIILWPDFEVET